MGALVPYIVVNLVIAAISLGIAYALRPDAPEAARDDRPPNLSTRGSRLDHVIGTRRCGALIGWVGNRFTRREKSGGGGKGGGGGSAKTTIYFESAWHQICVGPVVSLDAIFANGKLIYDTQLTPQNSPNGTTISIPKEGSFRIYWGDPGQPIDDLLAEKIEVSSRWPYCCYIVWIGRRLGPSPVWPQQEYVVTHLPNSAVFSSQYTALVESNQQIEYNNAKGINPAHALWRLITAEFPHGAGVDPDLVNRESFEELGKLCETELLASNIKVADEIDQTISGILVDLSAVMFQKAGQLHVRAIRYEDSVPILTQDNFSRPSIETTVDVGKSPASRVIYVIKNEKDLKYRDWDIKIDDDSILVERTERVNIDIATNPIIGNLIANRRAQERAIVSGISILGMKQARNLFPGDSFRTDSNNFRVLSQEFSEDTSEVQLECVLDNFSFPQTGDEQQIDTVEEILLPAQPDIDYQLLPFNEAGNYDTGSGLRYVHCFRLRAHEQIVGGNVQIGIGFNPRTFRVLANQPSAAGGTLDASIASGGSTLSNVTLVAANYDMEDVLDLSDDADSFNGGILWAVINNEIFYIDAVTRTAEATWAPSTAYNVGDYVVPTTGSRLRYRALSTGVSDATEPVFPQVFGNSVTDNAVVWQAEYPQWSINNLLRDQNSSPNQAHGVGATVYIIEADQLVTIRDNLTRNGVTLGLKVQPFTNNDELELNLAPLVVRTL